MNASKLYPNTYKGVEKNSGIISRNPHPTSARAPHYRGKIYLIGHGWFWLSGWDVHGKSGTIRLEGAPVTDEQAHKYFAPKAAPQERPASSNGRDTTEPEIPF